MKKLVHRLGPLLVLVIFLGAAWLLFHELRHYHIRDIRQAIGQIPAWRLWGAIGLTVVNYLVLIGYDYLAIRAISHPLPLGKVALASFTGFVTSYNFGALLGGTSVRYRLYTAWGLSAVEIVQLVVMLGITFWVGIFALAGVFFVVDPFPIPASLHLPFDTVRPLGYLLLVVSAGYVSLTFLRHVPIRIRETQIQLPSLSTTLLQLAVAAADLAVAAGCLYLLVSHDLTIGYGEFLGMYLLAVVAVIITHVPGGVGVFELIVLTLAAPQSSASMVAALLVFRIIYYLLPLSVALVLLAGNEISLQRAAAQRVWSGIGRGAETIIPTIVAWATLLAGTVMLLSGAIPIPHERLKPLQHMIPLSLIEISHFAGSLIGAGLLILARGLQRRLDAAWWLATGLLCLGIVVSLLKGLDYEEAIFLALIVAALIGCRHRFYRKGSLIHQRFTAGWIGAVSLVLACSVWLGLFAHKHVDYSADLWWKFAFHGDAPRFLRATVGAVVVLLLFSVRKLLAVHKPLPAEASPEDLQLAEGIVLQSPRTSSNLALLGDKSFLFNEQRNAFFMYSVRGRCWVTMGDPVGPKEEHAELVWQFRELVDCYDGWPVFYQVDEENLSIYLDQGLTLLKLGEEARVSLPEFSLDGSKHKTLRQTVNRCQREGCEVTIAAMQEIPDLLPQFKVISDAWLADKNRREKGFSLGFFDEQYLRRSASAIVSQHGKIIAFANLWCGADKEELSLDLMRYLPDSPASVMEFLFIELLLWGKQQGYQWFNLGMAPLSGVENRVLAPLWNRAVDLVFRHGDHFYNFEGLRQYKEKFGPTWTPKYLASPGGLALPQILADVTALIGRKRADDRRGVAEAAEA